MSYYDMIHVCQVVSVSNKGSMGVWSSTNVECLVDDADFPIKCLACSGHGGGLIVTGDEGGIVRLYRKQPPQQQHWGLVAECPLGGEVVGVFFSGEEEEADTFTLTVVSCCGMLKHWPVSDLPLTYPQFPHPAQSQGQGFVEEKEKEEKHKGAEGQIDEEFPRELPTVIRQHPALSNQTDTKAQEEKKPRFGWIGRCRYGWMI